MSTKTGIWMPLYWSDYFSDTTHFTTEEHGAYMLLIGTYWRRGAALPDDRQFLASAAKLTTRRFKSVEHTLTEKFVIVDKLWYHVRVEIELVKSCERIAKASASAYARWDARDMLPTTTSTKKPVSNKSSFNGGKLENGKVTILDPAERLSRFQKWLAEAIGSPQGWIIVSEASDPSTPNHKASLTFCKAEAKRLGKGWPRQWPGSINQQEERP